MSYFKGSKLEPLFREYLGAVADLSDGGRDLEPVRNEPGIVADKWASATKSFGVDTTPEDLQRARYDAEYTLVARRRLAALAIGLGPDLTKLFELAQDAIDGLDVDDSELPAKVDAYNKLVPLSRIRRAKVVDSSLDGYYIGGRFAHRSEAVLMAADGSEITNSTNGIDDSERDEALSDLPHTD